MEPSSENPIEEATAQGRPSRSARRARFLDDFPEHLGLSRAASAFENGNYAEVRSLCQKLLESEEDENVRACAKDLLRRIEPDRLIVGVLWASFALLVLVTLWAYGHGR